MDKKTANILVDLFVKQIKEQIDALKIIENEGSSDEFILARSIIAKTLVSLYPDALQPIFKNYPELKPDHLP